MMETFHNTAYKYKFANNLCTILGEYQILYIYAVMDEIRNYAEAALNPLHFITRKNRSIEAYLVEPMCLLQKIPTEAYNEVLVRVCLISGGGEPYASELRRQNFKTFKELPHYLQRQVKTLTTFPAADSVHWPHPDSM